MKKIIFISIYILTAFVMQSQETYFVTASSGLIIRDAPSISSNRVGKLPYGSTLELLQTTKIKLQIINDGETMEGFWVKVRFYNSPYIISKRNEILGRGGEGFVFSAFIEKLNKVSIKTTAIDSTIFYSLYIPAKSSNNIKITSEKEAEKLLASRVKWKDVESLGRVIDEIILENGQILKINQRSNDFKFKAYFPEEEVFLFEGGHSSDFSISIKTGESLETVGNPNYIIASPNKKTRLNGWFPGQECSSYFFQEKTENKYTYLIDFDEDVCYFKKFCWLNDQEFMYSYTAYSKDHKNGEEKYFTGTLIK